MQALIETEEKVEESIRRPIKIGEQMRSAKCVGN